MLTITDCSFNDNNCEQDGSDICLNSGITLISNSSYLLTPNPSSIYLVGGSFTGQLLQMTNTNSSSGIIYGNNYGSAMYASNMDQFYLNGSSFTNINFGGYGGVLYLAMSLSQSVALDSPTYIIENCIFTSNSAYFGGVLYLHNINYIFVSSCTFINNSAVSIDSNGGFGGAIYYYSSSLTPGSSSIFTLGDENILFQNNSADIAGGAIYWDFNQPNNITIPTYINNKALKYGDNYGCFAQVLKTITKDQYDSSNNLNRQLSSDLTSISIKNQQSGSLLNPIYIALFDEFGEIVGFDNSSTATLNIAGTNSQVSYSPTLSGVVTQTAKNGKFAFVNITFIAQPQTTFSLFFSTTGIDTSKPSNKNYLLQNSKSNTSMQMTINLRACNTGEMFTSTGACVKCEAPDYYLLTDQTSPGSCKPCQAWRMFCHGGSDVGPKPGFWRSSNVSDNFIQCLYPGACLGYVQPSNNSLGECFTGYKGILCGDCTSDFSKNDIYRCDKCPDPVWNVFRLLMILIGIIIWIIIMIRSTITGATQMKNLQSIYIKILMNHLQLLVLTSSFDFKWPMNVQDVFNTSRSVDQISTQFYSVDCFLNQGNLGIGFMRLFYQKMIIYAIIPIFLLICSVLFWTIYYCIKKNVNPEKKKGRIIATIIILLFLIHPKIVQFMFSNFNCKQIDTDSRVTDDLEIVCWQSTHIKYSLGLAVPSVLLWGFGIPLFGFVILCRGRKDLDLIDSREKYGFLYNGYKKNYYYWESVNMLKKIAIIFISAFLNIAGVITQALVLFFILILFLIMNIKLRPFTFQTLNDMEMLSIITCMLTIYCGLFFLSNMPQVYNSTDSSVREADNGLRLNSGSEFFLYLIILISNILFLIYWTLKMYEEFRNTMRSKMSKIYLYFCLCGNKERYKREIEQRAIQDENDILKEEFDRQLDNIRNLWSSKPNSGRLVLNRMNIEKSALYLDPKNFLNSIEGSRKLTEDEMKEFKRNKRRMESQRMMQNLINTIEYNHQNITSDPDRENTKQIFEEGKETERFGASIDRFIEIPSINQKTDYFRMNTTKQTIEDNSINIEEEILRASNKYILPNEEMKSPKFLFLEMKSEIDEFFKDNTPRNDTNRQIINEADSNLPNSILKKNKSQRFPVGVTFDKDKSISDIFEIEKNSSLLKIESETKELNSTESKSGSYLKSNITSKDNNKSQENIKSKHVKISDKIEKSLFHKKTFKELRFEELKKEKVEQHNFKMDLDEIRRKRLRKQWTNSNVKFGNFLNESRIKRFQTGRISRVEKLKQSNKDRLNMDELDIDFYDHFDIQPQQERCKSDPRTLTKIKNRLHLENLLPNADLKH